MENVYIVEGGRTLKGDIQVSGAKNVAMKVIISSLLLSKPVGIDNVPDIRDVKEVLHIIRDLGGKAEFVSKNSLKIDMRNLKSNKVDLLHGAKVRVSFMFLAPLLMRFGECYIPNPGGCRIGARPIDRIIKGVEALGGEVKYDSSTGYYYIKLNSYPKGYYRFEKHSHTGTEVLIMLGSFTRSRVEIDNAAQEPEVDELISFLNQAGANIRRENGKIIIEKGRDKFALSKKFSVSGDRNEAVTFGVLGLCLGEPIVVKGIQWQAYETFLKKVKEAGGRFEIIDDETVAFYRTDSLKPTIIETSPHPGFMTDWQPLWAVLMTQAQGTSFITERVFENRFSYVQELVKLGAKIKFLKTEVENPKEYFLFNAKTDEEYYQTIAISGKTKLHNGVLRIYDLRAGATLVIGALVGTGRSIILGRDILERGYEKFDEKIKSLGGVIKKI